MACIISGTSLQLAGCMGVGCDGRGAVLIFNQNAYDWRGSSIRQIDNRTKCYSKRTKSTRFLSFLKFWKPTFSNENKQNKKRRESWHDLLRDCSKTFQRQGSWQKCHVFVVTNSWHFCARQERRLDYQTTRYRYIGIIPPYHLCFAKLAGHGTVHRVAPVSFLHGHVSFCVQIVCTYCVYR